MGTSNTNEVEIEPANPSCIGKDRDANKYSIRVCDSCPVIETC